MVDYSQYVQGYKKRMKKEKKEQDKLFKELNLRARKAAKSLGEEFKVDKIYLFGSLNNRDKFHKHSDIDLAVEGLDVKKYIKAWGVLEKKLNHSFDLVQLEKAHQPLKEIIEKEGVVIYES